MTISRQAYPTSIMQKQPSWLVALGTARIFLRWILRLYMAVLMILREKVGNYWLRSSDYEAEPRKLDLCRLHRRCSASQSWSE
jgi:hypothetical protein